VSRGTCINCSRLLFPQYGDGESYCAVCLERTAEELAPAIEPRPGEPWQPVLGTIGGKRYGS
jgi:uncharacterized Zn finger protein (UPF0148 family)